jgi:hypothetical protein
MAVAKRVLRWLVFLLVLLPLFLRGDRGIAAGDPTSQPPPRQTTIVVSYSEYEWWLLRWSDNQIQCRLITNHEGLPTNTDVLNGCGAALQAEWLATPPCAKLAKGSTNTSACNGLYLHLVSTQPKQREVVITLPPPQVWVTLDGCTPTPPENRCQQLPSLVLSGEEPLPNEKIIAIHGTYSGEPFRCDSATCTLPLRATPLEGVRIEFWADSSYGDSSKHFYAQVRVIDTGVTSVAGGGWYVDVISRQWRGAQVASCAQGWEALPPLGGPPDWLSTPKSTELMSTDAPFYYLAGRLIAQGVVDATACPSGGLLPNGYADACGLEKARPEVEAWQNQFDERIIEVAQKSDVPAQLLKNIFAQESQFWPGIFRVPWEFGLGQITDKGADTILLWNDSFYEQFCPLILTEEACNKGYMHLQAEDQALLRGALAGQANSDCLDCPAGVDLSQVDFSLTLFADTIRANCEQVGQIVYNATKQMPGTVSTYDDLWRFTVANYHAGPGCISYAIHTAWQGTQLTWENVSQQLTEACRGVIPYVDKVTQEK